MLKTFNYLVMLDAKINLVKYLAFLDHSEHDLSLIHWYKVQGWKYYQQR